MTYRGGFETAFNNFKNRPRFIYWGGYIIASVDKIFKKKKKSIFESCLLRRFENTKKLTDWSKM